jgi:hypothetical protein
LEKLLSFQVHFVRLQSWIKAATKHQNGFGVSHRKSGKTKFPTGL